ncbi:hypothetical protein AVEN_191835-1 [Araneus ventricosus]|uniref:Uncharacterized protein n=1 Tax=Araneus ventricosus TaxID=182803 RepID=A0A4Y2F2D0_ARAVE|nr:hypothetical protein AVEN_191835-1 [Araneus ventricosus]
MPPEYWWFSRRTDDAPTQFFILLVIYQHSTVQDDGTELQRTPTTCLAGSLGATLSKGKTFEVERSNPSFFGNGELMQPWKRGRIQQLKHDNQSNTRQQSLAAQWSRKPITALIASRNMQVLL